MMQEAEEEEMTMTIIEGGSRRAKICRKVLMKMVLMMIIRVRLALNFLKRPQKLMIRLFLGQWQDYDGEVTTMTRCY